ncbi:MAG: RNA methyltransferase [Candidatus Rokubacteria bacterium]|nr:RNA methyltransferase [Candidatus Rokubacteria bacterium]
MGLGAQAALLTPGSADSLSRKAIRVSAGAALCLPWARTADWPAEIGRQRAAGYSLVALTPDEDALDFVELARSEAVPSRMALLLGAEGPGLSPAVRAGADLGVRIAMAPGLDSLNVAVASAIALHCLRGGPDPRGPSGSTLRGSGSGPPRGVSPRPARVPLREEEPRELLRLAQHPVVAGVELVPGGAEPLRGAPLRGRARHHLEREARRVIPPMDQLARNRGGQVVAAGAADASALQRDRGGEGCRGLQRPRPSQRGRVVHHADRMSEPVRRHDPVMAAQADERIAAG